MTLIDSDLPKRETEGQPVFNENEIVLTLHDGRLFRLKAW